jgi:hypothetical protein
MRNIVVALGLVVGGSAQAADVNYPMPIMAEGSGYSSFGLSSKLTADPCSLTISIDQPTFVQKIPALIAAKIFSDRVSPNMGVSASHFLMNTLIEEFNPGVVKDLFDEGGSPASCRFTWQYVEPDEYGNDKTHPIQTFTFTKATYQKINWQRFQYTNFPKVSIRQSIDPSFSALANSETIAAMMQMREDH